MKKSILLVSSILMINTGIIAQAFSSLVVLLSDKDSGQPIVNASVMIKEAGWISKSSDSQGKALFVKSIPIGEIHYIISKEGYQGQEGVFNITTEEKSNTLNVKISKMNDNKVLISGEVTDDLGRDLGGVTVEAKYATIIKTTTTDQSGNYFIEIPLNMTSYTATQIKIEAKYNSCKKAELVDLNRTNQIYKDIKLECSNGQSSIIQSNNDEVHPQMVETIYGVRVSLLKCELAGSKVTCHFIYENVSTEATISFGIEGRSNKLTDENGNIYNSIMHSVGNLESRGGTIGYYLTKGVKAKSQLQFEIGDPNIRKIASLEMGQGNMIHKFYNINLNRK